MMRRGGCKKGVTRAGVVQKVTLAVQQRRKEERERVQLWSKVAMGGRGTSRLSGQ